MPKKKPENKTESGQIAAGIPRVEAVVTVDARGQMVLPKELRERAGIRAGERLALMSWEHEGRVQAVSLMRVEDFDQILRSALGPLYPPKRLRS